jgi:hypothetical protein
MFEQFLAMRQVLRDQKYQSDELRKLVRERLRAVLISDFEHTSYYRQAMRAAGYDPRYDFSGPEDLAHLPILTKEILKETGVRAFVRKLDFEHLGDYYNHLTSGTTGLPLIIYRDRYSRALQVAKRIGVFEINNRMIVARHALQQLCTLSNQRQILPSAELRGTKQLLEKGMCRLVMSQCLVHINGRDRTNESAGQIHRGYGPLSRRLMNMVKQGKPASHYRL